MHNSLETEREKERTYLWCHMSIVKKTKNSKIFYKYIIFFSFHLFVYMAWFTKKNKINSISSNKLYTKYNNYDNIHKYYLIKFFSSKKLKKKNKTTIVLKIWYNNFYFSRWCSLVCVSWNSKNDRHPANRPGSVHTFFFFFKAQPIRPYLISCRKLIFYKLIFYLKVTNRVEWLQPLELFFFFNRLGLTLKQ